jgi:hypothetical protein
MAAALYGVITRLEHVNDASRAPHSYLSTFPPRSASIGQCPECRIYYCAEHQALVDGLTSRFTPAPTRGPSRPS